MNIKISIVIPIRNTPIEYFERCLKSIFLQTFDDYEVLVIDDGSENTNHKAYENICSQYPKINLFYIQRSGVSAARNYGISYACGNYIVFVDSDDTLEKNFLNDSYKYAKDYNVDFVIGKINYCPGPQKKQGSEHMVLIDKSNLCDLKKAFLGIKQDTFASSIIGSVYGKIYKRELLKYVSFPEQVSMSEDQIFNREYIDIIKNALFVPSIWYRYYQNEFSVMHDKDNIRRIKRAIPFFNYWDYLNNNEVEPLKKECFKKCIDFYYAEIHKNIIPLNIPWNKKKKIMYNLLRNKLFTDIVKILTLDDIKGLSGKIKYLLIKKKLFLTAYGFVLIKTKSMDLILHHQAD